MSRKVIVSVLGLASAGLLALALLWYSRSDRVAPVIQIAPGGVVYTPGGDESVLLEGVTAVDDRDGDLTGKVFIEKIVPSINGDTATVTYAVVDSSNNVAKVSRIVSYVGSDSQGGSGGNESKDGNGSGTGSGNGEAGKTGTADAASKDGNGSGQSAPGEAGRDNLAQTDKTSKEGTDGQKEESDAKENETDTEDETEEGTEAEDRSPREDGRPAIYLKEKKVTVAYGTEVDYMEYIDDIVDDKDGLEIWRSVSIDGRLGAEERGTHELSYYVTDSDGNVSDVVTLELTVE